MLTIIIVKIVFSFYVSLLITHGKQPLYFFREPIINFQFLITIAFIFLLSVIFLRLYKVTMFYGGYIRNILKVIISLFIISFVTFLVQLLYPNYLLSDYSVFLMLPISALLLMFSKGIFFLFLKKVNFKYALVCGPKGEAEAISKKILFDKSQFTLLKYVVYDSFVLIKIEVLYKYIDEVDAVYLTEKLSSEIKDAIISYCFKTQKPYFLVPKLYELALNKSTIAQISDTLVFGVKGLGLTLEQRFLKRAFDIIVSLILSVVLFPLMMIIGFIIKLYDKGPVLFKQKRMTRNNKVFTLYKFRSMIPDAEKNTGAIQAERHDKRITPIGKVLRATRMDELPQLINVIKGDMSLVGPRALRVEEINEFANKDPEFIYRLNVKAGVTGYAQTMGKYYTHFKDKLHFDILYIVNYSFFNDIVIIFETLRSIFDPSSAEGVFHQSSLIDCLCDEKIKFQYLESESILCLTEK